MRGLSKDDVIRMAQEAGYIGFQFTSITTLERFAKLIAAAEREACAKVCEEIVIEGWRDAGWDMGTIDCAAAIRARGNDAA